MENFIVTTVRNPNSEIERLAEEISAKLNAKFVVRENFSFDALKNAHGVENILLVKKNSLSDGYRGIFLLAEDFLWKILS